MTAEITQIITPQELDNLQRRGKLVVLIDVRPAQEFREFHAEIAQQVSVDSLNESSLQALNSGSRVTPLYFIFRTGTRAKDAARRFAQHRITNIAFIEGETDAWEQAGLPVVRDRKGFSVGEPVVWWPDCFPTSGYC